MRAFAATTVLLTASLPAFAQQPAAAPAQAPTLNTSVPTKVPHPALEIYQVDLIPTGMGFAVGKPVLDGDFYVFKALPEKQEVRVAKTKVRAITLRIPDLDQEAVYEIRLLPSGRMLSREQPVLKNGAWQFHTWKDNRLMSMRQTDVQAVVVLQGLAAFKAKQEEKGARLIGNLAMQDGQYQSVGAAPPPPGQAAPPPAAGPAGASNWIYDGVPGVTDAYAPPNAVVASPGDVPKAAEPPR
ncbi:MAG TPA: hypothetical protein VMH79_16280 [Thermoanaerobaculia bacterium]|nr:hypothetical protein [Thermoanaerobaculia bacterium]